MLAVICRDMHCHPACIEEVEEVDEVEDTSYSCGARLGA